MRFRGLPRHLNCGAVELRLVNGTDRERLPPCAACDFVCTTYHLLGCGHVNCDSCVLFVDENYADEPYLAKCSLCHDTSSPTRGVIAMPTLERAILRCPCSHEGTLRELSIHRRSCAATGLPKSSSPEPQEHAVLQTSLASLKSPNHSVDSGTSSDFAQNIKDTILEQMQRVEESIVNRVRADRSPLEQQINEVRNRLQMLESRVNVNTGLQNRVREIEASVEAVRTTAAARYVPPIPYDLERRLVALEMSAFQQPESSAASSADSDIEPELIRRFSHTKFLWFNVKEVLKRFNQSQQSVRSHNQDVLVGGYPLGIHVSIHRTDDVKTLWVYAGTSDLESSAAWPMRRWIEFNLYDDTGAVHASFQLRTINADTRPYFERADLQDTVGTIGGKLCSIEDLTNTSFYPSYNGMVCIGVEVDHL